MSIKVKEVTTVEVLTTDGVALEKNNSIILRIKTEDIVCRYVGMDNGYFVTSTMDGAKKNKYRPSSIVSCYLYAGARISQQAKEALEEIGGALEEAGAQATPAADQTLEAAV